MVNELKGVRVLVTGASGFIGGRLVERLIYEEGASVRALVHHPSSAVWLSRTSAEIVFGDLNDKPSIISALEGYRVVINCAAMMGGDPDEMYRVNVEGVKNLIESSQQVGIDRLVHLSSLAVHGNRFPNLENEEGTLHPEDNAYARTKLAADQAIIHAHQTCALPAVIIRPTIVYGPRSQWWTVDPIQRIKKGQIAILGKGDGLANIVFIEDVVDAILKAAVIPNIEGQVFLISGEGRNTWGDFFGAYASMLDKSPPGWPVPIAMAIAFLTSLIDNSISRLRKQKIQPRGFRVWILIFLRGLRKLAGPLFKLGYSEIRMYRRKSLVSVEKAKRMLGYTSQWPLTKSMQETEKWLRHQGYL